jgi:hypothetical protein
MASIEKRRATERLIQAADDRLQIRTRQHAVRGQDRKTSLKSGGILDEFRSR